MTDDPPADPDTIFQDSPDNAPPAPPQKMGLSFYLTLALIGFLVLMVVFLNEPAARANAGMVMTQTNWTLQSYTDATGIHIPVISGNKVTARFDKDARITGSAGCNWYSAAYQTLDYSINISGNSSTKMFCQGPGVMEQESAFLADLTRVSFFRVSETSLKFYDAAGKTVLVFVPE
jgi:heat shock protein HslJ